MSLNEILKINKYKLDAELVAIAGQLQEYSDLHVNAIKARDKQKLKLEVLEANLNTNLRKNWKELGFDKPPTVQQSESFVKINENWQQEQQKFIDLCGDVGYYSAACNSLQAKRSALGNLVSLTQIEYWASTPLDGGDNLNQSMGRRRSRNVGDEE
jgi:hypothetical protein